jgi:hypothetical protein
MTIRKDATGRAVIGKQASARYPMLWKEADPDIPIFVAAKFEFAKLQ